LENNHMTSQTLTTALLPPALPTLDLGPATSNYTASGITKFAAAATVTGDTTDKILGLQVRISSGNGTLGVVNGSGILEANGSSGKISYAYNSATKLLRLTDNSVGQTAIGTDFQEVLRNVGISGASGNVSISANLGKPVFRSDNGHYYNFVSFPAATPTSWTDSKTQAEADANKFLGLSGYLATVTDASENRFLTSSFDSRGWIGGQADASRKWTWAGGPEKGKSFWSGDVNGTGIGADIAYANWDTFDGGEPNNFRGNEAYVQFTTDGLWNDLANAPTLDPDPRYNPDGYWVEYGGATGTDQLAGTRDTIALTPGAGPTATPVDLVFYDPIKSQVSFAFTGSNYSTIATEGLTADTPVLTKNSDSTPQLAPGWRLISSNVDVDKDGVKDHIFAFTATNEIAVLFGEVRTGSDRQYAYRNSAYVTFNGARFAPGLDWTVEFASGKIGANNEAGIFWRSKSGEVAIWSFTTATATNGDKSATLVNSGVINSVGPNSGWRAVGDGEFNSNIATREVFWVNDIDGKVATWSLVANRTSRTSQFAWNIAPGTPGQVPTSAWNVVGIGNIAGTGLNDNIVWQQKSGPLMVNWTMLDGERVSPTPNSVLTLSATDRIKVLADVDGDGVLDLIGQFDGNGTIGAYTLTSGFALKNTATPRTQYSSNIIAGYRPAKGGSGASNLELVNVAQYNS
jgi:hypothetical protein